MKRNSPSIEKKKKRFGRNIFKIFFLKRSDSLDRIQRTL